MLRWRSGNWCRRLADDVREELVLLMHDRRRQAAAVVMAAAAVAVLLWLCQLPGDLFGSVSYSTVVEDRNGELIGARTAADGQWRFPPGDTVPERYALCLVQFEDRRFYTHHGVDPLAIARASVQNLRSGHTVSGGSTITMQVIRLNRPSESRTLREKIAEAFLAVRLELRCSKREILALYAAHAPFGGNVVGLEAASRRYFGRPSGELSWAEAAMLAVLPNSPSLMHPGRNRSLLEQKRNRLLTRLHEAGVIDSTTLGLSLAEPLPEQPQPFPQTAFHLVERLSVTNAGETVRTGIDLQLQNRLEALTDRWNSELSMKGIRDLAAVIVDVHTGEVIAYCGNAHPFDGREGAAVDIASSPRSTGSILKPFLYGAMLQRGDILPHTLIPDIPLNVGGFTPQNFDLQFSGAVSASEALERSLNVPYVRMLRTYGVQEFQDFLKKCGMTTLTRPSQDYGLSLILGGAEGKLLEITRMYASLSASYQGDGGWLPDGWPLTDRCAQWWIFDTLKNLDRPDELDWRLVPSLRRVAWKTGTSYGFRDAWAVGVDRDYAVGVWAGNANGESSPYLIGARTSGPVLFDIFNMLPSCAWFDEPSRGDYVYAEVCRKSGHLGGRFCGDCDSLTVPAAGLRTSVCPYHRSVLLTSDGSARLSSPSSGSVTENFFVLPPVMEWYYRRTHADYVPLPPFSPGSNAGSDSKPLAFIYPEPGSSITIPKSLDGSDGEFVCSIAHTNPAAEVFWHLDSEYVGQTRYVHRLSLHPAPGPHTLTAVDDSGNSVSVGFTIN